MRYVHVMGKDIEEIGAMMSLTVREDRKPILELYSKKFWDKKGSFSEFSMPKNKKALLSRAVKYLK
jgi:hypothetical protein